MPGLEERYLTYNPFQVPSDLGVNVLEVFEVQALPHQLFQEGPGERDLEYNGVVYERLGYKSSEHPKVVLEIRDRAGQWVRVDAVLIRAQWEEPEARVEYFFLEEGRPLPSQPSRILYVKS